MNKEIVELREVISKLVPLLAGKNIKVTQRGAEARVKVDPRTRKPVEVNIPSISDNATVEFVRAIQGFVDHEVGHVLITDWTVYANYEKTEPNKNKAKRIEGFHNIVEDAFVEREYTKIYPGSRKHLTELRTHFLERVTKVAIKSATSDKEQFEYLLVPLIRALSGQNEFVEFMDDGKYWKNPFVEELMKKLKPETIKALPRLTSTRHTLMVAREIDNILYPKDSDEQDQEQEQESDSSGKGKKQHTKNSKNASGGNTGKGKSKSGDDKDGEDEGKGKGGSGAKGEKSKEKEDENSEGTGSGSEDDEEKEDEKQGEKEKSDEKSDEEGDGEDKSNSPKSEEDEQEEDEDGEEPEPYTVEVENDGDHDIDGGSEEDENRGGDGGGVGGGFAKSMFDFKDDAFQGADLAKQISVNLTNEAIEAMNKSSYNVYSRENDKIEPLQIPDNLNSKYVPQIDDQAGRMVGKMQKDIERMMAAQSLSVRVPGHRSGRLQSSNLHRVMANDDRVFNRKHENRTKATAVTLLIDNSGSMSGVKIQTAMIAAYALAQTMERIGIPCEMLGFTTGGYGSTAGMTDADRKVNYNRTCALIMPIYKAFDERVNSIVKSRIAHMAYNQWGMNANVDGECLEYAAARLMKRREQRKVMIVLSDGQPAGANNAPGHLKATVQDLTKAGLDIVGIGIMDNSVKHFYPKHMVLNNVEDLPGIVMGELKRVLTS